MDVKKRSLGEICIFRVLKRSTSWSPVAFFTTSISHVWVDVVRKNNVVFGMLVFRLRNHQFECVLGNCTVLWVPPPSPIFFSLRARVSCQSSGVVPNAAWLPPPTKKTTMTLQLHALTPTTKRAVKVGETDKKTLWLVRPARTMRTDPVETQRKL